jgi:predicted transcriptional regulator of viral defense system
MQDMIKALIEWEFPYISGADLENLFKKSSDARYSLVKRAVQKGFLIPIRKDLYLIQTPKRPLVDSFEIAPVIYGPSYISFESALSYHGWIPEAVRTVTCATSKRSNTFETPLGVFLYKHIPVQVFPIDVEQHKAKEFTLFIASPWKALADLIYTNKKEWKSLENLSEDFRIELDELLESDTTSLKEIIKNYPSSRVKKQLAYLEKELHND